MIKVKGVKITIEIEEMEQTDPAVSFDHSSSVDGLLNQGQRDFHFDQILEFMFKAQDDEKLKPLVNDWDVHGLKAAFNDEVNKKS